MKKEKNSPETVSLRQKAEEQIKKKRPSKSAHLTEADSLKLLHELEVHQIELEMQNEELNLAKEKAKTATEKFTAIYDFAYTGYFTLNPSGKITELNLSGANMLGIARANLVNKDFIQFVTLDTVSDYSDFFRKVFKTNLKESCEVRLKVTGNPSIFVYIDGIISEDEQRCLLTVVDVTKRKHTEEILKLKAQEYELFIDLMANSEKQMIELKKEINQLLRKLGEKEKFKITD